MQRPNGHSPWASCSLLRKLWANTETDQMALQHHVENRTRWQSTVQYVLVLLMSSCCLSLKVSTLHFGLRLINKCFWLRCSVYYTIQGSRVINTLIFSSSALRLSTSLFLFPPIPSSKNVWELQEIFASCTFHPFLPGELKTSSTLKTYDVNFTPYTIHHLATCQEVLANHSHHFASFSFFEAQDRRMASFQPSRFYTLLL